MHMGCPALAGIDLVFWVASADQMRLPRTRGDRPCRHSNGCDLQPAAPHSRG